MPVSVYNPHEGNYEVIECKKCGIQRKILKGQMRCFTITCRNCHGKKWRRIE